AEAVLGVHERGRPPLAHDPRSRLGDQLVAVRLIDVPHHALDPVRVVPREIGPHQVAGHLAGNVARRAERLEDPATERLQRLSRTKLEPRHPPAPPLSSLRTWERGSAGASQSLFALRSHAPPSTLPRPTLTSRPPRRPG